jgi:hypothetical protein
MMAPPHLESTPVNATTQKISVKKVIFASFAPLKH